MDNERIEIPESGELPKVATRGWSSPTTRSPGTWRATLAART